MLGIGLLGKVAAGAIKGGAKKIATNKLLNREKKVMMGTKTEEEKGGSLAIRPTTSLVSSPTSAIEKYSGAGQESGGDETLEGIVFRIKTSVIQVESLLGNSVAFQKKQLDDERKVQETAELGKAEADLEKKKPTIKLCAATHPEDLSTSKAFIYSLYFSSLTPLFLNSKNSLLSKNSLKGGN